MFQKHCVFAGLVVACTQVGCDSSTVEQADDRALHGAFAGDTARDVAAPPGTLTYDDLLAQVAEEVPEFAGMYYEKDGALVLVLLEPDAQAEAEWALTAVFGEALLRDADTIRVEVGQYSFAELKSWYDRLVPEVLGMPGAVMTDIDERSNLIRVGVEDEDTARRASVKLRDLQIPSDVVVVELMEPVRPQATLQDFVRPLIGGLRSTTAKRGACTLGFPAVHGVTSGFVVNSHCTDIQGGVESTQVYSPSVVPADWVGTEALDPPYWANGCPAPGHVCRYSDAAFIASTAGAQGKLASSGGLYDFNIYGTSRVVQAEQWPVMGQAASKTGRTTSTTSGTIDITCGNVQPQHPADFVPYTMLCNYRVVGPDPMSEGGDSGSPVYTALLYNRKLVGIMWGGSVGLFWFSSLGGIFNDMGPMKVCVPNKPC